MAPNVNSFRRIRPNHSAPANVEWARDNRTCGLRVPAAGRSARRVENRLPGADANPYLAIAGSLIAGYLGIEEKLERSAEATGNAYRRPSTLPRTMEDALAPPRRLPAGAGAARRAVLADLPAHEGGRARIRSRASSRRGNATICCSRCDRGFQFRPGYREILLCRDGQPGAELSAAEGEVEADLVVVGGGCTGLSAALHAAERGLKVVLLEGGRIGWGASGRNGGQMIPGLRKGAVGLVKSYGRERARALFDLAFEARGLVLALIERHAIDCDLRLTGHLVGAVAASDMADLEAEAECLASVMNYRDVDILSAAQARAGRRHALSRRARRQARRPHASAQLHARPGARRRRSGRRRSTRIRSRMQPRPHQRHQDRHGQGRGARQACRAGRRCAAHRPRAARQQPHHAGRQLHRRDRAAA